MYRMGLCIIVQELGNMQLRTSNQLAFLFRADSLGQLRRRDHGDVLQAFYSTPTYSIVTYYTNHFDDDFNFRAALDIDSANLL